MSIYQIPATWRGRTEAGLPYKVLDVTGDAERDAESVRETILLPAIYLQHFLAESFPPVQIVSNAPRWSNRGYPGAPQLKTRRVTWKPHIPGKPADPYLVDPIGLLAGSYNFVLEVTIEYSNLEKETVLDIRASGSGQFLHVSAPKGTWVEPDVGGTPEQNRHPTPPITMLVPQIQWNATWYSIPRDWFKRTLLPSMRSCLGKVNSTAVTQLFDAPPETVLFAGFNSTYGWTRAAGTGLPSPDDLKEKGAEGEVIDAVQGVDSEDEQPLVNVEMAFIEKSYEEENGGRVRGHNDVWKPDEGWRYLLTDGSNPIYRKTDLNILFDQTGYSCPLCP